MDVMSNVVLVDEDNFARNIFEQVLQRRGYEVHSYSQTSLVPKSNGDSALYVVDSNRESLTWLRHLREQGWDGRIVLLSSVFDDPQLAKAAEQIGACLIIHKPISPLEFAVQIDSLTEVGLEESSDTMLALDAVVMEVAPTIEEGLATLESFLNKAAQTGIGLSPLAEHAHHLQILARQSGMEGVGNALVRLEHGASAMRGRANPHALAELRDILDTAIVESKREHPQELHVMGARSVSTIILATHDEHLLKTVERWGAECLVRIVAANFSNFLYLMRDPAVDGAILDAELPGILELARDARERQRTQDIPLTFLMPAHPEKLPSWMDFKVEAAHMGALRILEKPLEHVELLEAARLMTALRRAARPSVLIVDEDNSSALEFQEILEAEGMAVTIRDSATRIVEDLTAANPDVLILSTSLVRLNGHDACRIVRATPQFHDLPIMLVSSQRGARARVVGFRAGADDFLSKPVAREELLARLAIRIERMRQHRDRADNDMLTGLLTRRAFLEQASLRMSESRRKNRPLALCLLDIDRFKHVNDTYGHVAGDRVLAQLGRLLRSRFRLEDLRCRWGGEEFAIVLVDEDAITARQVLQRVLTEFSDIRFHGDDGIDFQCTFSGGIAEMPVDAEKFEALMRVADERLYRSKIAGRNRITV